MLPKCRRGVASTYSSVATFFFRRVLSLCTAELQLDGLAGQQGFAAVALEGSVSKPARMCQSVWSAANRV